MPSGRKETYAASFQSLDWGELYEKHDGYLLLEDLKAQWKRIVRPDYVLIDSARDTRIQAESAPGSFLIPWWSSSFPTSRTCGA